MDTPRFAAITRLVAHAPDRRKMLKLVGAAAVAGSAGFLARADDAEAALVTIVITDVLNNLSIDVDVKNNNVAVQVCAVVDVISSDLLGDQLTCEIQQ